MNNIREKMDRSQFEKIISSITIPEDTPQDELQLILKPIRESLLELLPQRLYKYRSCCKNHINAFKDDQLWLSTSDLYNDPFDTLIRFNGEEIMNAFSLMRSPEMREAIIKHIADGGNYPQPVDNQITEEYKKSNQEIAEQIIQNGSIPDCNEASLKNLELQVFLAIQIIPLVMQHMSTSACFSEDVNSILMWSHYSDLHKGFALGYDLSPYLFPNKYNLGLFPVIYNNQRYDATEYLCYLIGTIMKLPLKNADKLSQIKLLLYKAKEWEYEKEWRLINGQGQDIFKAHAEPYQICPNSIYYGCHISNEDFNTLHTIAKEKNLLEYKMQIDNAANTYEMKAIEIT